jgi:hypothetical protein
MEHEDNTSDPWDQPIKYDFGKYESSASKNSKLPKKDADKLKAGLEKLMKDVGVPDVVVQKKLTYQDICAKARGEILNSKPKWRQQEILDLEKAKDFDNRFYADYFEEVMKLVNKLEYENK